MIPSSCIKQIRRVPSAAIVDVTGDIDLNCSHEFQQGLLDVLDEEPKNLVINLTDVNYMDSSGIASLVKLLSRSRRVGASLTLVGLSDRVKSLFEITRLDSVFRICSSEKDALP